MNIALDQTPETQLTFFACCGIIFIIIIVIGVLYYYSKKEKETDIRRCPICNGPVLKSRRECQWCGHKIDESYINKPPDYTQDQYYEKSDRSKSTYMDNIDRKVKDSKDTFFSVLGKKNICSDCKNELVWREEYQSWYCQECHSYK